MRVVLVGGGGREAALAWRIAQSPTLTELVVTSENPGWPAGAVYRPAREIGDVVAASRGADLVVVGPEAPLAAGLADALVRAGVPCFGPERAAARLESSKAFTKEIARAACVPTAPFVLAERGDPASMRAARERAGRGDVVVKVDGLAAGKGVFVCESGHDALQALDEVWRGRFGAAADRVLLEDRLVGPEVSLFALSDGERVVALPPSRDHKRLSDGDTGPNTGGMGAYAPTGLVSPREADALVQRFHLPVVRELARRGTPFRGVLYAGLMLTRSGPMLLEYNVRFGDPECQPLMCLWRGDVLPWLHGAAAGRLPDGAPRFDPGAACCVVLASDGYPGPRGPDVPIPEPGPVDGVQVFFAGARRGPDGVLRTAGGRVLGVTGTGATLEIARRRAYDALDGWRFPGARFRTDIGAGA